MLRCQIIEHHENHGVTFYCNNRARFVPTENLLEWLKTSLSSTVVFTQQRWLTSLIIYVRITPY